MSLIDKLKQDVKKSGQSKSKFIYFKEGQKQRVRFLTEMEEGMEVVFHDNFEKGINVPCQEAFGKSCPYCDEEDVRTRSQYAWSVWNYETKEVQLFIFPVNNCSPIPALMAMYETYGTITDRDYVISVSGKQQNRTFSVVPMDKVKFRNDKAKAFSKNTILKMIDKAFPCEETEDEDYKPTKKSKKQKVVEDDFDDEDDDYDEESGNLDYSEMSPKELYSLCKERNIDAAPKKKAAFYITLLEEYDEAQNDWDDEEEEDDEDEWEDE